MSNYLALTIGPIYDTLTKARKIREIWMASYLFSYLTRLILKEMTEGEKARFAPQDFVLPYLDADSLDRYRKIGVGLWPDRLILQPQTGTLQDLQEAIQRAMAQFAGDTYREFHHPQKFAYLQKRFDFEPVNDPASILTYFQRYFRIYCLELTPEELAKLPQAQDSPQTFVHQLDFLMDNLELQASLAPVEDDPIQTLLRAANRSFLIREAFHREWRFESLAEIATRELMLINPAKFEALAEEAFEAETQASAEEPAQEEDTLLARLKEEDEFKRHLRTYHRYLAVVHADGDKIGALVGKLGDDPRQVRQFSQDLLEFAYEANHIMAGGRYQADPQDWGGGAAPVYLGGDDLVFFAPVARRESNNRLITIFDLIQDLDQAFAERFEKYAAQGVVPTLSYGVAITYYKYPMQEAMAASYQLLQEVKADTPRFKQRNNIRFQVLKHSGRAYGSTIDKNQKELHSLFLDLIKWNLPTLRRDDQRVEFLSGIAHTLDSHRPLLAPAMRDQALLDAFFANQFNEPVHKHPNIENYLNKVKDFMNEAMRQGKAAQGEEADEIILDRTLDQVYAALRFVHFLNSNDNA